MTSPTPPKPAAPGCATRTGKTGVLIANLGTPDATSYRAMRRYLREFLSDRRVIDYPRWKWLPILHLFILTRRPFSSGAAYRKIWNTNADESPLLTVTRAQAAKLSESLAQRYGDAVIVDFCMRYATPSTDEKVAAMIARGVERILFFPLYPQYAAATTATANDQFFRALMKLRCQPSARTVAPYFSHPAYIDALAGSVEAAMAGPDDRPEVLVASYHGMPERYRDAGDPYHDHCRETSRLLAARLGWGDGALITSFQSRFGPAEWLKPYTVDEVARLAKAGTRRIAVIAPAFSADCLETLEEINGEIRASFMDAGGESFTYIPCLNDGDAHIAMMADLASANLGGWTG